MNRKWWLIGGGIALAAVLLVGGQLWLTRQSSTPSPAEKPAPSAAGASQTTTDVAKNAGSATPGGAQSTPTATAPAAQQPAKKQPTAATPPSAAMPFPAPASKPYAVSGPVEPGRPLGRLTNPPVKLIAGYAEGALPAGSAYTATIKPWGYASGDTLGPTVVVTVSEIGPIGSAPRRDSLNGENLLLVMSRTSGGYLRTGGSYSATVTFVADGGRLVPMLGDTRPITR